MPRHDFAPRDLAEYDPQLGAPPDLEEFWAQTLAQTRAHDLGGCAIRIETPLLAVETLDGWSVGDTGDPNGLDAAQPGFLTRGIAHVGRYYYRRAYAVAVRAVEFVRTLAEVNPWAIAVTGASQGGGLALATAALEDEVAAVMPDVPFLCDFRPAQSDRPRRALRRDRPVPERASGPRTTGVRHPGLLRLRDPGPCRHRAGAVLGGADGPDLPSLDRICRIQRLRRPEGDRRLRVQRPRGWRGI